MTDPTDDENPTAGKEMPRTPKTPRVWRPRLNSIAAVRKELSRQYGLHLSGEVGNKALDARVRCLRAVTDSFVAHEQEARLQELELRFEQRVADGSLFTLRGGKRGADGVH